ncbi:hypothetical protein CVT24_001423 [Panaeolus cyanescens]|uniref:Uncharacterized protein n=1 Tax=Panaeolus cyanescens TaxID=181874 RepID=A0A409WUR5_9AGAR|nr:hypothetical protein CVT24_001423 [Panaeolus cyanescens]
MGPDLAKRPAAASFTFRRSSQRVPVANGNMFEVSARALAVMAGYYQWGLDALAGHHQDNWNVIQTGPNYVEFNPPPKLPSDTEKKRKQRPLSVPRQNRAKS